MILDRRLLFVAPGSSCAAPLDRTFGCRLWTLVTLRHRLPGRRFGRLAVQLSWLIRTSTASVLRLPAKARIGSLYGRASSVRRHGDVSGNRPGTESLNVVRRSFTEGSMPGSLGWMRRNTDAPPKGPRRPPAPASQRPQIRCLSNARHCHPSPVRRQGAGDRRRLSPRGDRVRRPAERLSEDMATLGLEPCPDGLRESQVLPPPPRASAAATLCHAKRARRFPAPCTPVRARR